MYLPKGLMILRGDGKCTFAVPREPCVLAQSLQSCLTLYDPMDCSLPGSTVHVILQARILEWVASFYSRVSSRPRDRSHVSYVSCFGRWVLYHSGRLGSP